MPAAPEMKEVQSTNVHSVGHDGADLYVQFRVPKHPEIPGALYCYPGVPKAVLDEMLASASIGRYVQTVLARRHPAALVRAAAKSNQ